MPSPGSACKKKLADTSATFVNEEKQLVNRSLTAPTEPTLLLTQGNSSRLKRPMNGAGTGKPSC